MHHKGARWQSCTHEADVCREKERILNAWRRLRKSSLTQALASTKSSQVRRLNALLFPLVFGAVVVVVERRQLMPSLKGFLSCLQLQIRFFSLVEKAVGAGRLAAYLLI